MELVAAWKLDGNKQHFEAADGAIRLHQAAHAAERAESMGWRLNHEIKGHRVSDFPHAIYQAGKLADFEAHPSPGVWVLEIQIAHPARAFGAFYEDLLIDPNMGLATESST